MIKHSFRKTTGNQTKSAAGSIQTKKTQSGKTTIQAKLKIGRPNDAYEQEADRVADQVVRSGAAPQLQSVQNIPGLQSKTGDEELQAKPLSPVRQRVNKNEQSGIQLAEEEELQAKSETSSQQTTLPDIQTNIDQRKGGGSPLSTPVKSLMESKIGADFSSVRIHNDDHAHKLSTKLNAQAFAVGNNVFFNQGKYNPETRSGKHLLAHELTHTVQQGASTEKTQGTISSHNPGIQTQQISRGSRESIQRYVFVGGKQIDKAIKQPDATMQAWTGDMDIRDYKNLTEFKNHSTKSTDYLGILKTGKSLGTWVRFEGSGINILGESHNKVTLQDITPAVGTTSFIRERFATDDLSATPVTESVYEDENSAQFQAMGIDGVADKRKHGGESIFPKIGVALISLLPLLSPSLVKHLKSGTYPNGREKYSGKPYQRYAKLAWAWSSDNLIAMQNMEDSALTNARFNLAQVHVRLESKLNPFFASLTPDGFIGDALSLPANAGLYTPLQEFANAFLEVVYEMVATDKNSPLSASDQAKMKAGSGSKTNEKLSILKDLRNRNIHNAVIDAAKRGVRYAGMGRKHLEYLQDARLKSGWHAFDMVDADLKKFEDKTKKLQAIAK